MGSALKIENLNPLTFDPVTRRVMKDHPNFRRRVETVWDESLTAKRTRRAIEPKVLGKNYEPLF